jgi:hypothetical protein
MNRFNSTVLTMRSPAIISLAIQIKTIGQQD